MWQHIILAVLTLCIAISAATLHKKPLTISGRYCTSPCYNTKSYFWCYDTTGSWDYCSPLPGYDRYARACKNYACEDSKYMGSYWCYLQDGGWDYCASTIFTTMTHYTYKGDECVDICDWYSDGFSYCTDKARNQRYCSPSMGYAVNYDHCSTPCENKGYSFTWCYTSYGRYSWNYCSFSSNDAGDQRVKRQARNEILFEIIDSGNRRSTTFTTSDEEYYPLTNRLRAVAREIIWQWWKECKCVPPTRGTIIEGVPGGIRLDLQGTFEREGTIYTNIQLQVNIPRRPGESTTVAHVEIPRNLAVSIPRYLRWALFESLHRGVTVTVVPRSIGHFETLSQLIQFFSGFIIKEGNKG